MDHALLFEPTRPLMLKLWWLWCLLLCYISFRLVKPRMVAPDNVFRPRSQNYVRVWRRAHVFLFLVAAALEDFERAKLKDGSFVMKVGKVGIWDIYIADPNPVDLFSFP